MRISRQVGTEQRPGFDFLIVVISIGNVANVVHHQALNKNTIINKTTNINKNTNMQTA